MKPTVVAVVCAGIVAVSLITGWFNPGLLIVLLLAGVRKFS